MRNNTGIFQPPYAYGGPAGSGVLKQTPEDFFVDEILGFSPSGQGEHVFLHVEKIGENTDTIAAQIAKFAQLPRQSVSYAGLKDRHARTAQWFSVHLPGKQERDWQDLNSPSLRVLEACRHNRKLKKGTLKGNRFQLRIRAINAERTLLEQQLHRIANEGAPNYFGPQRFGHDGQNIEKAKALFDGSFSTRNRHLRGILLSAARAHIFNRVLALRVEQQNWNQAVDGDAFTFPDSHSFFCDTLSASIHERIAALQLHPSGPLWGEGDLPTRNVVREWETSVATLEADLSTGLERNGLEMGRRALRVNPGDLHWQLDDSNPGDRQLLISFTLPAGAYATTLLREALVFDATFD